MSFSHPYALWICHACDEPITDNENSTSGLLAWTRDDRVHYEEPRLCAACGHAIGVTALYRQARADNGG